MNSENPYQSPGVDVDSDSASENRSLAWLLFSSRGRIPRRVFWACSIAILIVYCGATFVVYGTFGDESDMAMIGMVVVLVPTSWCFLTVQLKRWHDRNKSVFWLFLWLVPILGPLWAFVETGCLRGMIGPNRYGPDPT